MIGLGAKYLTAAGFGRYRITAASLGNLNLLHMLWDWLTAATKQAILGAFGQTDGKAVIKATNAYLTQLAASGQAGKDKATALAALINEDPMMVCSLGLSGVLQRRLVGDGVAYINTLFKVTSSNFKKLRFEIGVRYTQYYNSQYAITGIGHGACFYGIISGKWTYGSGSGNGTTTLNGSLNVDYDVTMDLKAAKYSIEGVGEANMSLNNFRYTSENMYFMGMNDVPGTLVTLQDQAYGRIYEDDVLQREMLPFRLGKAWSADKVSTGVAQAKDTLGMIDLVTGIFYPNAASSGAFTMEGEPTP